MHVHDCVRPVCGLVAVLMQPTWRISGTYIEHDYTECTNKHAYRENNDVINPTIAIVAYLTYLFAYFIWD